MVKWVPVNRYRMVNLQTGRVVVVFQPYPGMKLMESFRQACCELDIELDVGYYRLDSLKQNKGSKRFQWSKLYRFSLEVN